MKVLHLETGRSLYGGALQVLYLLEGLRKSADTHELVAPPGTALGAAARQRGHTVHEIPFRGDLDLGALVRLRTLFRRSEADLVHLHSRRGADLLGALAARWTPVPAVLSRRVDEPEKAALLRLKTRWVARVVAISQAVRGVLTEAGVPDTRIEVIPSAVDTDRYAPDPDAGTYLRRILGIHRDETVVGMAAQFIPRKGHRVLLRALPEVVARHPQTRFVLFGQGPEEEALRETCRGTPAGEHLLFAGFREDLPDLLPGLDLLVHPALREGLGVILLQAAACGIPAIASRAGGMPEVIRDAETGLLVPPDDPSALAQALHGLLEDRAWRQRLGQAARQRALEHFSLPTLARRHQHLYHRLLSP